MVGPAIVTERSRPPPRINKVTPSRLGDRAGAMSRGRTFGRAASNCRTAHAGTSSCGPSTTAGGGPLGAGCPLDCPGGPASGTGLAPTAGGTPSFGRTPSTSGTAGSSAGPVSSLRADSVSVTPSVLVDSVPARTSRTCDVPDWEPNPDDPG